MKTKKLVLTSFFAALIAVTSQLVIPLPMVPINLAVFAVFLTATMLPTGYALGSVLTYILLGAIGVPVFNSFQGGLGILFGKTGGYIIGYIAIALIVSLICNKTKFKPVFIVLSMVLGLIACYAIGTAWFMFITNIGLMQSLVYCVFPFLIGDMLKIALAVVITLLLKKRVKI